MLGFECIERNNVGYVSRVNKWNGSKQLHHNAWSHEQLYKKNEDRNASMRLIKQGSWIITNTFQHFLEIHWIVYLSEYLRIKISLTFFCKKSKDEIWCVNLDWFFFYRNSDYWSCPKVPFKTYVPLNIYRYSARLPKKLSK